MKITFSIIQVNCLLDQFEKNFEKVKAYLFQIPVEEKHLVVLPELWTSGFSDNLEQSYQINQEIISQLQSIAKQRNLIISGSYIIKQTKNYFNQLIIIGPHNKVATYNKINLFPSLNEYENFKPGTKLSILNIWNIKIGMAICYDLRFPELFRNYASKKVEICVLPAQWPEKRINHFNALLLARAIENQMIFASSNVCGTINNTKMGGNSSVIDHMGSIQSNLYDQEAYSTTPINIENVYHWRKEFPVLEKANLPKNETIEYFSFEE
jgi:predicted amidohydrolase